MRNILKDKRGVAPLFFVLGVILVLVIIYILLFLPFPAFTKIRTIVNYFLIIILWIVLQVGIIYGYIKVGGFIGKSIIKVQTKIQYWSMKIKRHIIAKG
jgi:uncharacterized membrane protein YkvI